MEMGLVSDGARKIFGRCWSVIRGSGYLFGGAGGWERERCVIYCSYRARTACVCVCVYFHPPCGS